MKISRDLHRKIENYFRFYFKDETIKLPEVEIFVRRGAWLFSRLFIVNGITFGRRIFIRPELIKRSADNRLMISKNLLVHELTHTIQYQKEGFFGFLFNYFKAYFTNLRKKRKWDIYSRAESYLEIPHEIEARDSAARFIEWLNYESDSSSSSFNNSK